MSDAVDDAMEDEDEGEGEEVESDKILKEVLDEIGMNMNDAVSPSIQSSSANGLTYLAGIRANVEPDGERTSCQLAGCRGRGPDQLAYGACVWRHRRRRGRSAISRRDGSAEAPGRFAEGLVGCPVVRYHTSDGPVRGNALFSIG